MREMQEILSCFSGVQSRGSNMWQAKCPVHNDKKASLSITKKNGKVLFHCHAGCKTDDVLKVVGLTYADISPDAQLPDNDRPVWVSKLEQNRNERIIACYDYTTKDSKYLYSKVRFDNKNMTIGVLNGDKTYFKNGRKGIAATLYNLPELVKAVEQGKHVYYVEGEKDVDTLKALGLPATTAGSVSDWKQEYAEHFKGAAVVILPDNDEPGRKLAERVYTDLKYIAASVKVVPTSAAPHGDVTDWLNEGHTKDELLKLVESAGGNREELKSVTVKELIKIDFPPLVQPVERLICEGLTILVGASKVGKSWLSLQLCYNVATGKAFLGRRTTKSSVLYLALEDSYRRLKDRLGKLNMSVTPDNFSLMVKAPIVGEGLEEMLDRWLEKAKPPAMVVIDTLQKIRGVPKGGGYSYADDYATCSRLKEIADKHRAAIVCLHHTNKKKEASDPFDMVSGTTGIMGSADTTILLLRERGEDEATITYTGRDVYGEDMALSFNGGDWKLVSENAEEHRKRRAYENSAIVQFIKKLVVEHPEGGKWLYTELEELASDMFRHALFATPREFLTKLKPVEAMLEKEDSIKIYTGEHITKSNKNGKGVRIETMFTHGVKDEGTQANFLMLQA